MAIDVQEISEHCNMTRLVSGIVADAEELMRQQLTLLRLELKQDLRRIVDAGASVVAGVGFVLAGVILFCFAIVHALSWLFPGLPLWGSFAIVSGFFVAVGAALLAFALLRIRAIRPLSNNAALALKETMQWQTIPK